MKKRGGGHEGGGGGHDGSGGMRWLLTYSDMITLLLALFIFLYSISEVNVAKLNVFSQALAQMFGIGRVPESSTSQSGGSGILPESNSIVELQRRYREQFKDLIRQGMVEISSQEAELTVRMRDKILFPLGSANLTDEAIPILGEVGALLKDENVLIRVEGHTDNLPVAPGGCFPSNWELSGARAAAVVRFFEARSGIDPGRLSLAGHADTRPLHPNRPSLGNAENRRVEIVVVANDQSTHKKPSPQTSGGP